MGRIVLPYNWRPRSYQLPAWKHFEGNEPGKRGVCVWHRRAGKDLLAINLVGTKVFERRGLYWHLLPTYKQGRAIVWNGFTKEGRKFLDYFPPEILAGPPNKSEMKCTFTNGSLYQVVGTDDINSLVGTNPVGCILSEYSLHDPAAWDYLRPILRENGGWALFIYTARGRNHGYKLKEMAAKNPRWLLDIRKAGNDGTKNEDGTPVISDLAIQEEREEGMPEELIAQEYFCSFDAPLVGSYYGAWMAKALEQERIFDTDIWEPKLEVHTAWDLGLDDSTAIWFIQEVHGEIRLIDYYENSGEGLGHYAKVLKGQWDEGEHRAEYNYGKHFFPHDVQVRELGVQAKSRKDTLKSLGIKVRMAPQHEVEDGIEAVRTLLPKCYFSDKRCERGVEALRSYRREWNDKLTVWRSTPVHDWASHAADALRIYAMARKGTLIAKKKPQQRAVDNYDYLKRR